MSKKNKNKKASPDWTDNFISIQNKGISGICPYCKSEDTDYQYVQIKLEKDNPKWKGYLEVWCNICDKIKNINCLSAPPKDRKIQVLQGE